MKKIRRTFSVHFLTVRRGNSFASFLSSKWAGFSGGRALQNAVRFENGSVDNVGTEESKERDFSETLEFSVSEVDVIEESYQEPPERSSRGLCKQNRTKNCKANKSRIQNC